MGNCLRRAHGDRERSQSPEIEQETAERHRRNGDPSPRPQSCPAGAPPRQPRKPETETTTRVPRRHPRGTKGHEAGRPGVRRALRRRRSGSTGRHEGGEIPTPASRRAFFTCPRKQPRHSRGPKGCSFWRVPRSPRDPVSLLQNRPSKTRFPGPDNAELVPRSVPEAPPPHPTVWLQPHPAA